MSNDLLTAWNTLVAFWNTLVALGIAVFLYVIWQARKAFETGVKSAAEEGAKIAINDKHWREELRQEIEKTRSLERQDLRFKSYGALWKNLRPLALYSDDSVDQASVKKISIELTNWYFSENGGSGLSRCPRWP
jgi:hypothetical protein